MINIQNVVARLEHDNPNGFINEAHFQVEFGFALKNLYPSYDIIYEWANNKRRVDILAMGNGEKVAFEFKYFTKKETRVLRCNTKVDLKNQANKDLHRIGFWKDVEKLEGFKGNDISYGYCLLLTNDERIFDKTNNRDKDFDISDGNNKPGKKVLIHYDKNGKSDGKYDVNIKGSYNLLHKNYGSNLYLLIVEI